VAFLHRSGSTFRYAGRTAEEINSDVSAPSGTRCQRIDEIDAGDALAQRPVARARGQQNADGIAQRKRGAIDERAKARIALRVHRHFDAERNDLRGPIAERAIGDQCNSFIAADRVDAAAQD
jgi:hypothetical protein